jgi:hypothetical protein
LYIDDRATPEQRDTLTAVFLGRTGGAIQTGFTAGIVEVHAVKSASIELDHTPARERIEVPSYLIVRTRENVPHDFTVVRRGRAAPADLLSSRAPSRPA